MMSLSMSAQQKWTLQECIDYAMQNSITLKQAKLSKQTATETRKQSQAALFPSLSASSNQSFGYRPGQSSGMTTVSNGTVDNKVTKTYYNGKNWKPNPQIMQMIQQKAKERNLPIDVMLEQDAQWVINKQIEEGSLFQ